jgi:Na+-translocating ferredoxin:NAD+ oxidoreductase subunit G
VREIIRLSLTLAVVGIVSAAILTGVYIWTAPIIEQRQQDEYLAAVREYFPSVSDTKTEELDGDYFDLVYDSGNTLLGIMATIQTQGYDGLITYNLAVDGAGTVIGMRIISHSDTPGIGDYIENPDFQKQFIGKGPEDPIQPGVDVDTKTGATVSTSAMVSSIRRIVGAIAMAFLDYEEEIFEIALVPDGTYQGTGRGLMGDIRVEVEVEGGRIISIKVLDQSETPTYFVLSHPLIIERIIEEQQLEVDTATGATASAEGIISAVLNALTAALEQGGGEEE